MKGCEGYMVVKVDLEKAYDRLEWSFIHNVLQAFRFSHNIIKLIMSCISTSSLSMLVNGCTLEAFNPSRGIRQEDHLSPYLFIMCMEHLGCLIEEKCSKALWCPLKASRGNIKISHLLFAGMISSYLLRLLMRLVKLYLRCCGLFVWSLDRKSAVLNLEYIFPQMLELI